MSGLEATLRITAIDDTGPAFRALKAHMEAVDAQISVFDKLIGAVSKVSKSTDMMANSLGKAQRAFNAQSEALGDLTSGLDRIEGASGAASEAQMRLRLGVNEATAAIAAQGSVATRVSEKLRAAQERARAPGAMPRGGMFPGFGEMLPFAGPLALDATKHAIEAGATVEERIAQLRAAGATPEQIGQARGDFREFSKTHAGVLESDYLAGFKDARVIAPLESFDMAKHAAVFRAGLRNSGLSIEEGAVGDALRVMDELALKTDEQRKEFLNQILKTEQTFGNQVPISTMLAAIRNAKSAVYQMSPDFINKYLPTLLQSAGQAGGTEIMTAYSNFVGQHMTSNEAVQLAHAGLVNNKDLLYDKTGKVKGFRPGAKFFEEGLFGSNIAQWAWDTHKEYMGRKGSSEAGWEKMISVMPRNMGALVDFWTHNEQRVKRDAATREGAIGDKAADNDFLATNPVAGWEALKNSVLQLGASVTGPAIDKGSGAVTDVAGWIQGFSKVWGDLAAKYPNDFGYLGLGAIGGAGGWGIAKSIELMTGIGRAFGLVGGAGVGESVGTGLLGVGTGLFGPAAGVAATLASLIYALGPEDPYLKRWYHERNPNDPPDPAELERSRRSRLTWHPGSGSWVDDPEAHRGRVMSTLQDHVPTERNFMVSLDPNSKAEIIVHVTVSPTGELISAAATAKASSQGSITATLGHMDSDAAPIGRGGIGRR